MMKSIVLITFFCLILTSSFAQKGEKFKYQSEQFGNLIVTPTFDHSKGQGKHGEANYSDLAYVNNLVYGVIKEVFPKEKLFKIHLNSSYLIYFNSKGEIINCTFILNPNDTSIISEDDLYNLYTKFKNTKVDGYFGPC